MVDRHLGKMEVGGSSPPISTILGNIMYKYKLWVSINSYQTAETIVYANNDYEAKLLGEAQYGVGNILNYTRID